MHMKEKLRLTIRIYTTKTKIAVGIFVFFHTGPPFGTMPLLLFFTGGVCYGSRCGRSCAIRSRRPGRWHVPLWGGGLERQCDAAAPGRSRRFRERPGCTASLFAVGFGRSCAHPGRPFSSDGSGGGCEYSGVGHGTRKRGQWWQWRRQRWRRQQ